MTIKKLNKNLIAITIGDIDGIGINLLLSEVRKKNIRNFILFTNIKIFKENVKYPINKINIIDINNINNINKKTHYENEKINIINYETTNKYTNTLDSLKLAYKLTKEKYFKGILTLPLNKNKINLYVDKNFVDQTSFFSKLENSNKSNMFFVYENKFFIPLTIHIELKKVHKFFKNKQNSIKKILSIIDTLKNDFKIKNPKIIMSGINPHAGENGIISQDENKNLKPVIQYLRKMKIDITGPISGDGMINNYNLKKYDVFIFTFHDQALIPFKLISNYGGVNFTSQLNIIRTSPSHGTAENLIGSINASSKGIINSIKLINKISKNRN